MKKNLFLFLIICLVGMSASGCAKRVKITTIEKERIDQDTTAGNQGFIAGTPPPQDEFKVRATTREIYQVTLDLPPYPQWKNFRFKPTEDKKLWGNRGYIYGGPQLIEKEETEPIQPAESENIILPDAEEDIQEKEEVQDFTLPAQTYEEESAFTDYVVKKGDTLQKISLKVYGTTKKWKKIFDFNSGVLKNPNKIYPGQKIKIPQM
ncbi:MAG: LysM peptidoglycan-binding domain-containing protein [Candidatus Omnitrophota bacterium]